MPKIVSEQEQLYREELAEELFGESDPSAEQLMGKAFDWIRLKATTELLDLAGVLGMKEVICDNCPYREEEDNA